MPAERAGYTVTMFLIDISPSMGKTRMVDVPSGPTSEMTTRDLTNFEWSLQYVLLKIQEMVIFNGRKTEQCGVILFGTEGTDNIINQRNGGYDHVTEYIPIAQPNAGTLAKLRELTPSTAVGDPIDGMIVAVETQDKYLGNKKTWTRKLVLITDGENQIETEDWQATVKKMNILDVITTVIGIDFDDTEFGFIEENKSSIKRENESFFREFVEELKSATLGTCALALQECVRPDVKMTKSALLGSVLRLGDVEVRPDEAIEIHIKTSKCTSVARPASAKKFSRRVTEDSKIEVPSDSLTNLQDHYPQLKMRSEYFIEQETDGTKIAGEGDEIDLAGGEARGRIDDLQKVDKEELVRGFKYGSSYVPCPDGQFPRLTSNAGIDICGFFLESNVRRDWAMSEISYVWADPSSGREQVFFSSIVQAMVERGVVAFARWVSRDGMDPKMGLLVPRMMEKVDCFLWVQMPFADDLRKYSFQSLQSLVNRKGEAVEDHPYIPTNEQLGAMGEFVDAMDLMHAGDKDEEGQRMPWFDPTLSYNPTIHRVKQALFHAATVNDLRINPVPPPHPEVIKYLNPPERLINNAHHIVEKCKTAFKIKEVPKRVARKRKDGHVRAEDDDDEVLLLDRPATIPKTLVPVTTVKDDAASCKMDVDDATEPESDDDEKPLKDPHVPLPTPAHSHPPSPPIEGSGRAPGRIVGRANPLDDFKKNLKSGDIVSKAVEDLAWVIKDIVMKPFASRRQGELLECMQVLRATTLIEDEVESWNIFLRDLKKSCTSSSGVSNRKFWEAIRQKGPELGLISAPEAARSGGKSSVSMGEADDFF